MKVLFSHGKESGPWGSKIKRLASIATDLGCMVDSIDYVGISDPDLRVEHLLSVLKTIDDDLVLVGSSMGGYVSLVASEQVDVSGVFLLAPALFIDGYKKQSYFSNKKIEIVHGWSDEVIPYENSVKFAKKSNCSLHLIAGDHRLNSSIDVVGKLFTEFLAGTVRN